MGIRPRASALSRYASILSIAHIGSECTKAISSGSMGSRGNPDLGSASYPIQPGFFMLYWRDRATSPSPAPKIALSHHVARAAPHQPQIPLKSNPHPAPSRMATTSCYHWVKRWPGLPRWKPGQLSFTVTGTIINPQIMRQALGTRNQTGC